MEKIAFISGGTFIYWSSIVLALGALTAILCFVAAYLARGGKVTGMSLAIPLSAVASLYIGRLIHWYSRTDAYESFESAMTELSTGTYALMGAFIACLLVACLLRLVRLISNLPKMLDAMAIGGGCGIAVGRLASLFNSSCRGIVLDESVGFPFAYPVVNAVSGAVENRLATFMIQSMTTTAIVVLLVVYLLISALCKKKVRDGDSCLLFLLAYGACQIVCDSTRYDSLFLRSNGFISIVQILGLVGMLAAIIVFSVRLVKEGGFRFRYVAIWVAMLAMFGGAGYMEYHVQRHGDQAAFAYSVMSACLAGVVLLTLVVRAIANAKKPGGAFLGNKN